jgi:hypothetical protein
MKRPFKDTGRQVLEPGFTQRPPPIVVFYHWSVLLKIARTLDVNDRVSPPDKNVHDYELLFFVAIHIAMKQMRRNMEESLRDSLAKGRNECLRQLDLRQVSRKIAETLPGPGGRDGRPVPIPRTKRLSDSCWRVQRRYARKPGSCSRIRITLLPMRSLFETARHAEQMSNEVKPP